MTGDERLVLTPREAAQLLGVSRETVYQWIKTGAIPTIQMGDNTRMLIPRKKFLEKFDLS